MDAGIGDNVTEQQEVNLSVRVCGIRNNIHTCASTLPIDWMESKRCVE